jgi:hypothetical protein
MLCLAKMGRRDRARDTLDRLRDTHPDISRALVESLVRDFYDGTDALDESLAMARDLWDEAPSGPQSA